MREVFKLQDGILVVDKKWAEVFRNAFLAIGIEGNPGSKWAVVDGNTGRF
jgi:hypothetical protein